MLYKAKCAVDICAVNSSLYAYKKIAQTIPTQPLSVVFHFSFLHSTFFFFYFFIYSFIYHSNFIIFDISLWILMKKKILIHHHHFPLTMRRKIIRKMSVQLCLQMKMGYECVLSWILSKERMKSN